MTSNQIAYWNLQETKRANRAQEKMKADLTDAQVRRYDTQNVNDTKKVSGSTEGIISDFMSGMGTSIEERARQTADTLETVRDKAVEFIKSIPSKLNEVARNIKTGGKK